MNLMRTNYIVNDNGDYAYSISFKYLMFPAFYIGKYETEVP
jgi:hypothetical protein